MCKYGKKFPCTTNKSYVCFWKKKITRKNFFTNKQHSKLVYLQERDEVKRWGGGVISV